MIEYVRDTEPYVADYLHVPDEIDTADKRKQWILSTGIVPEGYRLSWFAPSGCQEHVFDCANTRHDFERETETTVSAADSLRRLSESLNGVPRWAEPLSRLEWEPIADPVPRGRGLSDLISSTLDSIEPAPDDDMPRDSLATPNMSTHPWCSYIFCTCMERTCTCHRYHNGEGVEGGQ
jgi:hypothetical protein